MTADLSVLETVGGLVLKSGEGWLDKAVVCTLADVSNVGVCPVQYRKL